MKKITYGLIIITIMLFLGLGFFQKPLLANTENKIDLKEDKLLNITTVSKDQYYMVKSIVKDKHNVEYLSNDENEICEFKYNEDIVNNISERDLFIYYGVKDGEWVNKFIDELKKGDLGIINMSRGIKTLTYEKNGNVIENPYYWLGISEYKIALYNIKSAIQEKDPKNKSYYEENYTNVINEIEKSIKEVKLELDKYKGYTVLTNTNTFDYLLKDLGLSAVRVKDEIITKRVLKENNLDENKVIFIKEKNPIENDKKLDNKIETNKSEDIKKLDDKEMELEKIVEVKELELVRWDGEKTLVELASLNIKLIIDSLREFPIEVK